jgi:hypothetical protein
MIAPRQMDEADDLTLSGDTARTAFAPGSGQTSREPHL